jgi:hypothetical protein
LESQSQWLLKKLQDDSNRAVDRLCEAGCDRDTLLEKLAWLATIHEPDVVPAIDPVTRNQDRRRGHGIGPRDSWKHLLGGLGIEDLGAIRRRAEDLISDVNRLRRTPFVARLRNEGRFHPHGVLGSTTPAVESSLSDLLLLPDLAREYGPGSRVDHARNLAAIYRYIRDMTGHWHDAEMVPILHDITPDKPTVDSLKKWRSKHDLTRSKR